jgi:hypothetical protein
MRVAMNTVNTGSNGDACAHQAPRDQQTRLDAHRGLVEKGLRSEMGRKLLIFKRLDITTNFA